MRKGNQLGPALMKLPGSVLRITMSANAQLCYLRGRYSDSLDDQSPQDSGRLWLSYFLSTLHVVGCGNIKFVFGLSWLSFLTRLCGRRLTRADTNSDTWFKDSISA